MKLEDLEDLRDLIRDMTTVSTKVSQMSPTQLLAKLEELATRLHDPELADVPDRTLVLGALLAMSREAINRLPADNGPVPEKLRSADPALVAELLSGSRADSWTGAWGGDVVEVGYDNFKALLEHHCYKTRVAPDQMIREGLRSLHLEDEERGWNHTVVLRELNDSILHGGDGVMLDVQGTAGPSWIPGPPVSPGYHWVIQWVNGDRFGPAVAYVYDGYPDNMQPPRKSKIDDPEFLEWSTKTEGLGVFLRARLSEGFGAGDHELRRLSFPAHIPLSGPSFPAPSPSNEYILSAAIWIDDGFPYVHQKMPTGFVVGGHRHNAIIEALKVSYLNWASVRAEGRYTQGFITNTGRFVDRIEGGRIARAAAQTSTQTTDLHSEDLY